MARTKKTARQSTGGSAPRKQLTLRPPETPVVKEEESEDEDWSVHTKPRLGMNEPPSSPAGSSDGRSIQLQSEDGDILTVPVGGAAFESLTLSEMIGSFGEILQQEAIAVPASARSVQEFVAWLQGASSGVEVASVLTPEEYAGTVKLADWLGADRFLSALVLGGKYSGRKVYKYRFDAPPPSRLARVHACARIVPNMASLLVHRLGVGALATEAAGQALLDALCASTEDDGSSLSWPQLQMCDGLYFPRGKAHRAVTRQCVGLRTWATDERRRRWEKKRARQAAHEKYRDVYFLGVDEEDDDANDWSDVVYGSTSRLGWEAQQAANEELWKVFDPMLTWPREEEDGHYNEEEEGEDGAATTSAAPPPPLAPLDIAAARAAFDRGASADLYIDHQNWKRVRAATDSSDAALLERKFEDPLGIFAAEARRRAKHAPFLAAYAAREKLEEELEAWQEAAAEAAADAADASNDASPTADPVVVEYSTIGPWAEGIAKVLAHVHPDIHIDAGAVALIHSLVMEVFEGVVDAAAATGEVAGAKGAEGVEEAEEAEEAATARALLDRAVDTFMGGGKGCDELAKHAKSEARKYAVDKLDKLVLSREATEGFLAERLQLLAARNGGGGGGSGDVEGRGPASLLRTKAAVNYLTALVEYHVAEVLELAGNVLKDQLHEDPLRLLPSSQCVHTLSRFPEFADVPATQLAQRITGDVPMDDDKIKWAIRNDDELRSLWGTRDDLEPAGWQELQEKDRLAAGAARFKALHREDMPEQPRRIDYSHGGIIAAFGPVMAYEDLGFDACGAGSERREVAYGFAQYANQEDHISLSARLMFTGDRKPIEYVRGGDGITPLMVAAARSDLPMINFLLDSGANVNAAQPAKYVYGDGDPFGGLTALACASTAAAASLLLARGADATVAMTPPQYEATLKPIPALLGAFPAEEEWGIRRLLVEHGANPNDYAHATYRGSGQNTYDSWDEREELAAFWPRVVLSGDVTFARRLLVVHGAAPNWPFVGVRSDGDECSGDDEGDDGSGGASAAAVEPPRPPLSRKLVSGSGLGPYAGCGATVLMLALLRRDRPMAELLLAHGADPNQCEDVRSRRQLWEQRWGAGAAADLADGALRRYLGPEPGMAEAAAEAEEPSEMGLGGGVSQALGLGTPWWIVDHRRLATPLSVARGSGDAGLVALLRSSGGRVDGPLRATMPYLPCCPKEEQRAFAAAAAAS